MLAMENTAVNLGALNLGIKEICLRLACAMLVGMVIGTEREYTNRPAGMRTHILVALGACVAMLTGQLIFAQYYPFGASPDPARLAAQVITGVGFLGAGTILREGASVKGLTTAASLWAVACLGVAAGGGYYLVALAGMAFVFVTLTIFEVLQHKLMNPHSHTEDLILEAVDIGAGLGALNAQAAAQRADIRKISVEQTADGCFRVTIHAEFGGFGSKIRQQRFFTNLSECPQIRSVTAAGKTAESKL